MNKVFRCKKCLTPSTRPRITFNNQIICNACQNYKKLINFKWEKRFKELFEIAEKIKKEGKNKKYNCIIPVGGGKDSSYVAWHVKNTLGLKPLCVCCEPPLFTRLGKRNLKNFAKSGFKVKTLKFNKFFRDYDLKSFKEIGIPQQAWLTAIAVYPVKIAVKYGINYIFEGEEPESCYGGTNKNFMKKMIKHSEIIKYVVEGKSIEKFYTKKKLNNFKSLYLTKKEISKSKNLKKLYWSSFEKWDEVKHYKIAKEKCGLICATKGDSNSINIHSHLDQVLYSLHMYLAYLKFGFSRATTDASIAIRLGYMKRSKGIKLVRKFDHIFPSEHLTKFLKYFKLDKSEFFEILKSFINKKIFKNKDLFNLKLKQKF